MTDRKRPVRTFASDKEEAEYWFAHKDDFDLDENAAWEEVERSPQGRSVFANDPETQRLRKKFAKLDAATRRRRVR